MIYHDDVIMKQEQYRDMVRQAERDRLALAATAQPKRGPALHRQALDEIGVWLVRLGRQLQVRFGSIDLSAGDCARPGEVPC